MTSIAFEASSRPLRLHIDVEVWPLKVPFCIAGCSWSEIGVVVATLEQDGCVGRGEAAGVFYLHDDVPAMVQRIENVRGVIESGINRQELQGLLPAGGARNALDCALWDLEAKRTGRPVWEMAGLHRPLPLVTTFTCGSAKPNEMAEAARSYRSARALKLKLTGEEIDAARVRAVRAAAPQAWLGVDGNQSFTPDSLEQLMPALMETGVALIEQPFPRERDAWLDDLRSTIPLAADESVQCVRDIPALAGRFNIVNIKLDKCGGLTEGLAMVRAAHAQGLGTMVGNTLGTSLGMAPAFLLGQLCSVVDLDGPVFLKSDRALTVHYEKGFIRCPEGVWGANS